MRILEALQDQEDQNKILRVILKNHNNISDFILYIEKFMGSVCATEERVFRKIDDYSHPPRASSSFKKAEPNHNRFGNIQRIRTQKNDIFKLIMATNDAKMQTVSVECRILESTADFELYEGTKFQLQDLSVSPIIDLFDPSYAQIYHPIKTLGKYQLTLKAYPFKDYSDNVLKRAIYEIWLYGEQRSMSPLKDFFIMTRGKASTMVMIFKKFEVSLFEIVRYRQLANNYHWSQAELVTLWKLLVGNYKLLKKLQIYHRDIRLSKIFFISDNIHHPFQFANLATARKMTRSEASDLLTVVGVSLFAESPMREKIEQEADLAMYNPLAYDCACLVQVLLLILNLKPMKETTKQQQLKCNNERLAPIIKKLRQEAPDFDQIEKDLDSILSGLSYKKAELFNEDKIISEHLRKSELRRKNREKIYDAYFDSLLHLHKKETFNRFLINKIDQNESHNRKFDSPPLLHRTGIYYASVGLQKNQYFEEEFRLLLELARECREEEFYTDHYEYLEQLAKLKEQLPKDAHELTIIYENQMVHNKIGENNLENAKKRLDNLMQDSQRYKDIRGSVQLDILITKIVLEIKQKNFETAENQIEKLTQLVTMETFETQYERKKYQAKVDFLRGLQEVQLMNNNAREIKPKRVAVAEISLTTALNTLTNLPESNSSIISIINAYLVKSDLSLLKEDYPECRRSLESADVYMNELESRREISDELKKKVLERLKKLYVKSNRANQPAFKTIIDRLNKMNQGSQESNAARHQRSKQLRTRQLRKNKVENKFAPDGPIPELNEDEEGRD